MATYLPTAADFDALVRESRARHIDPIEVALLMYFESAGFEPGPPSERKDAHGNFAVGGLNQMAAANLAAYGIPPERWLAMSAADQIPVVFRFWDGLVRSFSGGVWPTDAARLEALNFLPGIYAKVGAGANDNAPLAAIGDGYYAPNVPLDPNRTGAITVSTIRDMFTALRATTAPRWAMVRQGVQDAIGRGGGVPGAPSGPLTPPTSSGAKGGLVALAFVAIVATLARGRALFLAAAATLVHAGGC